MSARSAPRAISATLDELVEVTFTVSPRVRRIAAHNPERSAARGIFAADLLGVGRRSQPRTIISRLIEEIILEAIEVAAGRKGGALAATAGGVHHCLRAVYACRAVHRGQRRADARAAELSLVYDREHVAQPDAGDASGPVAHRDRKPHRHARPAGGFHRRRRAARASCPSAARSLRRSGC